MIRSDLAKHHRSLTRSNQPAVLEFPHSASTSIEPVSLPCRVTIAIASLMLDNISITDASQQQDIFLCHNGSNMHSQLE